jgi:hypothetical protein
MNNEPVAVVDHRQQNGVTWLKIKKGCSVMPEHNTLLYTHPAKTLTDEEILRVHSQMMEDSKGQLPPYVDFARAILKKASEK